MKLLLASALLAICLVPTVGQKPPPVDPSVLPDVGYPVEVVVATDMTSWADSTWLPQREAYRIRLSDEIPEDLRQHFLVHEWAHLLVWDACVESDHGPIWGVAYARCYRAAFEE